MVSEFFIVDPFFFFFNFQLFTTFLWFCCSFFLFFLCGVRSPSVLNKALATLKAAKDAAEGTVQRAGNVKSLLYMLVVLVVELGALIEVDKDMLVQLGVLY